MQIFGPVQLQRCGIEKADHVLAAVSGGADSTALLLLLAECRDRGLISELSAAHFNHCLRGNASDGDEAFCRNLCLRLSVPFYAGKGDVKALAEKQKNGTEIAARQMRYDFLNRVMAEIRADCIAVAHHADDQAETVLQHLLRGTGPKGLCAMDYRSGSIVRPLLDCPHAVLLAYLSEQGQEYRRDETNDDTSYGRNRIRHELIPELRTYQPRLTKRLCALASDLRADEAFFAPAVERLLAEAGAGGGYRRSLLLDQPDPIRKRALMKILNGELSYDISRNDVERLDQLLRLPAGKHATLHNGAEAWNDGDILMLCEGKCPEAVPVPLLLNSETKTGGWSVRLEKAEGFRRPDDPMEAFFTLEESNGQELTARPKKEGDRFRPLGMQGTRLVSDIYTDRKFPVRLRSAPLVCLGNEIIFIPGYTISETVRVRPDSKTIIHISVKED